MTRRNFQDKRSPLDTGTDAPKEQFDPRLAAQWPRCFGAMRSHKGASTEQAHWKTLKHKKKKQDKTTGVTSVNVDTPVQIFSQYRYFSTKHSVSMDIPAQNSQSARILQYKIFSQCGYSSTKYSVSRDVPVQNIQSVGIFQYKTFNQ